MLHTCIKPTCAQQYEDEDIDAYYCFPCRALNKKVALELEAKIAARPRKETISALAQFDSQPKINGFVHVKL